ncbi:hypothetical protein FOA43_001491 [Brettanomyces nanus]|uniref:Protein SCD5 n=1 Tax=Eeniella nana TaxID=13502 RepID=A0A875RU41_EENNA|nr:uncharacterized protein FOA43_001491 [Brettanomyces nanus]QPG74167.1 hypothetical protein FOA43_001491 [Brettanomyces nanus]
MSDNPQFDWYKIPGLNENTGVIENSKQANGIGQNQDKSTALNDLFNKLRLSRTDRAFHSDDSIAILHSNQQTANGIPSILSSTAVNEDGRRGGEDSNGDIINGNVQTTLNEPQDSIDDGIPLSLAAHQLSRQEVKTYLRWYDYIESRKRKSKGSKSVTVDDVFQFLSNFGIDEDVRSSLRVMFARWASSLSIGRFFALLRLLAHALNGDPIVRSMIREACGVPKPVSIMARKRQGDEEDDDIDNDSRGNNGNEETGEQSKEYDSKLDLDSFTQFILTGERPSLPVISYDSYHGKKKHHLSKKVKFSDEVICQPAPQYERRQGAAIIADEQTDRTENNSMNYQLPMETLLKRLQKQKDDLNSSSVDDEDLKEMEKSIDRFRNVKVDSMLIGGVSATVPSIAVDAGDGSVPIMQPLAPNLTGSVSKSMRTRVTPQFSQPEQLLPGTDRAYQFLESALTGKNDTEPFISPSIRPSIRPSTRPSVSTRLSPPPPPPPRRMSSPPQPVSLSVPQPQLRRPSSPSLPPKPLLNAQQRQQFISTVNGAPQIPQSVRMPQLPYMNSSDNLKPQLQSIQGQLMQSFQPQVQFNSQGDGFNFASQRSQSFQGPQSLQVPHGLQVPQGPHDLPNRRSSLNSSGIMGPRVSQNGNTNGMWQ